MPNDPFNFWSPPSLPPDWQDRTDPVGESETILVEFAYLEEQRQALLRQLGETFDYLFRRVPVLRSLDLNHAGNPHIRYEQLLGLALTGEDPGSLPYRELPVPEGSEARAVRLYQELLEIQAMLRFFTVILEGSHAIARRKGENPPHLQACQNLLRSLESHVSDLKTRCLRQLGPDNGETPPDLPAA
jgi:hypothetical protein